MAGGFVDRAEGIDERFEQIPPGGDGKILHTTRCYGSFFAEQAHAEPAEALRHGNEQRCACAGEHDAEAERAAHAGKILFAEVLRHNHASAARDADQADVQAFEAELKTWSNVKSVTYKDKDDALAEYTSKMSGNADATMSALDGQNPLPASFAIEMDDPSKVESTAQKLKKNADFQKIADDGDVNASVLYGQEEVSRLFQVTNYIRIAAVVLVGLLTFIAFIFINNTIRLSITARRREIAIMRLVGASNGFIRGPFITEGVLQAILGSLLSIGVLELLRNLMIPRLQESIGWMSFALPMQYYLVTYAALILVGVIIGLFGSAIAMRRYLRV